MLDDSKANSCLGQAESSSNTSSQSDGRATRSSACADGRTKLSSRSAAHFKQQGSRLQQLQVTSHLVDNANGCWTDAEHGGAAGSDLRSSTAKEPGQSELQERWETCKDLRVLDRARAKTKRLGGRLKNEEFLLRVALDGNLRLSRGTFRTQ